LLSSYPSQASVKRFQPVFPAGAPVFAAMLQLLSAGVIQWLPASAAGAFRIPQVLPERLQVLSAVLPGAFRKCFQQALQVPSPSASSKLYGHE
jgi:hypothetical protein